MRRAWILTVALAAGCASSYGLPEGDATYDAVKAATTDCKAKGGTIELKSEGDGRKLSDYRCKIGGTN